MQSNWLSTLADQSLGNFEATAKLDEELSRMAVKSRDNNSLIHQLYTLLAAKICRFAERFRYWSLQPWTFDDVLQETYEVFIRVLHRWQPRQPDGAAAGFLFYFFKVYPLWLSDAVKHLLGRKAPPHVTLPVQDFTQPDPTDYEGSAVSSVYIDELCDRLEDEEASILRLRVAGERSISEAATVIGLSRRTAYRRWGNVLVLSREFVAADRAAS